MAVTFDKLRSAVLRHQRAAQPVEDAQAKVVAAQQELAVAQDTLREAGREVDLLWGQFKRETV